MESTPETDKTTLFFLSPTLVMKCGLNVASIWIICGLNNTHNPRNPDYVDYKCHI